MCKTIYYPATFRKQLTVLPLFFFPRYLSEFFYELNSWLLNNVYKNFRIFHVCWVKIILYKCAHLRKFSINSYFNFSTLIDLCHVFRKVTLGLVKKYVCYNVKLFHRNGNILILHAILTKMYTNVEYQHLNEQYQYIVVCYSDIPYLPFSVVWVTADTTFLGVLKCKSAF